MFHPNDKVLCIDDSPVPPDHSTAGERLTKGTVYCVTETDPSRHPWDPGGIRIVGPLCFNGHGDESWWRANRFRSIEDIRTENRTRETVGA